MQDTNPTPPAGSQVPEPTPVAPETPVSTPEVASAPVAPTPEAATAAATTAPVAAVQDPHAKNFLVALLLSIFLGNLGIDRFYLGHIGLGVAKLLLNWLTLGIWWLVDVILIATKKVKNVTWES